MSSTGAFQYWQRSMIHAGPGTVIRLAGLLQGLGARRVLLVSDPGLKQAGLVDLVASQFDGKHLSGAPQLAGVYCETAADAESGSVDKALRYAREVAADALVALGGGSVLDSVKLIKLALHHQVESVAELLKSPVTMKNWPEVKHLGIAHVAIPTTAGTGAEITHGAVILNKALGIKHLVFSDYLEADIAILDAHMTVGLPPMLTAATGMDALTHAVESLAHPGINHFALAHASTSAKLIMEHLPRVVANGADINSRQVMLNASAMACNAVAADFGAAPIHNFSHAIGAVCHIHHGEANAVLLPLLLEEFPSFYEPVADRFADVFALHNDNPTPVIRASAVKIRNLLDQTGHPRDFSRHSIPQDRLAEITMAVAQDPLAAFRPLSPDLINRVTSRACGWS